MPERAAPGPLGLEMPLRKMEGYTKLVSSEGINGFRRSGASPVFAKISARSPREGPLPLVLLARRALSYHTHWKERECKLTCFWPSCLSLEDGMGVSTKWSPTLRLQSLLWKNTTGKIRGPHRLGFRDAAVRIGRSLCLVRFAADIFRRRNHHQRLPHTSVRARLQHRCGRETSPRTSVLSAGSTAAALFDLFCS